MPETRAELLDGMIAASQIMHEVVALQTEASNLNEQYCAHVEPVIKTKSGINGCAISLIVLLFGGTFFLNSLPGSHGLLGEVLPELIFWAVVFIGGWKLLSKRRDKTNESAQSLATQQNADIDRRNEQIAADIHRIREQLAPLQQRWAVEIAPWYPMDYDRLDAVDFFVTALRNQRADSIGELVNLYETEGHRRRMEAGQREMIAHQRIGNMLQLGSLVMQGAQLGQMQQANGTLKEINANAASATSSASQAASAANSVADKWGI